MKQISALKVANTNKEAIELYETYSNQFNNRVNVEYIDSRDEIAKIEPNLSHKGIVCLHHHKVDMLMLVKQQKYGYKYI